jgi:Asp/Glu/hydantoin racemase
MITLIHTSASMLPVFKKHTDELLPGRQVVNMVDESLLCDILREGRLPPATARRLVSHVCSAADAGASHIIVTCSSMGPAVEASQLLVSAKVSRVDEAMISRALTVGNRVGVLATLPSTLAPTVERISRSRDAIVTQQLVAGAFQAVITGDGATHDRLVGDAIRQMWPNVDVILLAQASMARAADALAESDRRVPILSSPRLAIEALARELHAN